jgi:nucleoside-diphosphate-sugar epimerase
MRLLVLGGTGWLGGEIAAEGVRQGHHVTCLARGTSATPARATFVRADRDRPDAYDDVREADWDAVIDVASQPGRVRRAVQALADRTPNYVFVSSGNVYVDHRRLGDNEDAELLPPLQGDVMDSIQTYGEAKVACERHVLTGLGADRSMIVRAGLIGGPGDVSDRSGYWPLRFARPATADGSVLVPAAPDLATQLVDARDLAAWIIRAAHQTHGTFDATGDLVLLGDHLRLAREVAGHTGSIVAAEGAWLLSHGVRPWMGERSMPLWLPDLDWAGMGGRDNRRARAAGLALRPLAETLADTLDWELSLDPGRPRNAGLCPADERDLLQAFTRSGAD